MPMMIFQIFQHFHHSNSQSAGQPQFSDQNDVCQQYSSSEGQKRSSVTQRRLKASQIVLYLKC